MFKEGSLDANSNGGFSLIELVVAIVIVGVLSAVAAPVYINLQTDARIAVVERTGGAVRSLNQSIHSIWQMPSTGRRQVDQRITDLDIDRNGSFETRLLWGWLDNTDVVEHLELSPELSTQLQGLPNLYIGYDFDEDGQVNDDQCYFWYTQALQQGGQPRYQSVTGGC